MSLSIQASKGSLNGLAPGVRAGGGRYLLKRVVGQGGMGVVWLAYDKLLRDQVALKFLPSQLSFDPAGLESLRRETLQSRKLSHPNILRIHDLIETPDEPTFISMEYVDGPTLHGLRANRPGKVLTWRFLSPLLKQLCTALDYAHGEKVIHRDIKPANLMLESSGRLKLADFGLARVISDTMTRLSGEAPTSGTLAYMSPQQADGKNPRVTDDIYSLGATLYELLTSTPPFYSGDLSYQVRNSPPEGLDFRLAGLGLNNAVPQHVSALIMSCLSKDPAQRPQSAAAILNWLESAEREAGIPPTERIEVPARPLKRSKLAIAALAMAACAAAGAVYWKDQLRSLVRPAKPAVAAAAVNQVVVEPGFESLFNGKDLSGWDYDPTLWRVKDGMITANSGEELVTRRENTCLIWKTSITNFELRLRFRLRDITLIKTANSGVNYRSRRIKGWQVRGYQCDLNGEYTGTLILLEDNNDPHSQWGHCVTIKGTNGASALASVGVITKPEEFHQTVRTGEWNDLVVVANGNHLLHKVNDVITMEATVLKPAPHTGVLALELKRATSLEYKDIRLKRL